MYYFYPSVCLVRAAFVGEINARRFILNQPVVYALFFLVYPIIAEFSEKWERSLK